MILGLPSAKLKKLSEILDFDGVQKKDIKYRNYFRRRKYVAEDSTFITKDSTSIDREEEKINVERENESTVHHSCITNPVPISHIFVEIIIIFFQKLL